MLVAIGLIVAVILVAVYARPDMRQCRWREDRTGDTATAKKYVCAACGAVALTETRRPPRRCLRRAPER